VFETPKRIQMLDHGKGVFRFLQTIDIALPNVGLHWHGEDIDAPGVEAAAMYGCLDPRGSEVAYVLVGDVSGDPTEPTITSMTDEEHVNLGIKIEDGTRDFCRTQGFRFIRWMGSEINHRSNVFILVSAYIVNIEGIGNQQRITARFVSKKRMWLIETAFSVEKEDILAKPMFLALHPVNIADNRSDRRT